MKRTIATTAVLLGVAAYAGLSFFDNEARPVTRIAGGERLSVSVATPRETTIVERVGAAGTLVPRETAAVTAELVNARVLSLSADVGDHVRAGDRLAVLDAESQRLQVAQMEADYARTRDDFERIDSIRNSGAVSQSQIVEKRSALAAMKAKLDDARLAVRRAVVTAPADGVVFERRATVGTLTTPGEALFRIAVGGEIEAELRVPEARIGRVRPEQAVTLRISGRPEPLSGRVRLVTPRIDAADRSASVRVAVAVQAGLTVGAYVHGEISLGTVSGLAVPDTAVQQDAEGAFLWTVKAGGRIGRRAVTPLLRWDGLTLLDGATPDLQVVIRAGSLVRSGDLVRAVEAR